MTHDIDLLCRVIDAGDDTALPALADALEDAGDERAAGLRVLGDRWPLEPWWNLAGAGWRWVGADPDDIQHVNWLPYDVFLALPPGHRFPAPDGVPGLGSMDYPSRSAAFLALAETAAGA